MEGRPGKFSSFSGRLVAHAAMDGFSEPITWSRNFDEDELDEEDVVELPKVTFSVRNRSHLLSSPYVCNWHLLWRDQLIYICHCCDFQPTEEGTKLALNGKLKTKLLLIGTRTAASVFLHATYENPALLGEFKIENFGSSVRAVSEEGC